MADIGAPALAALRAELLRFARLKLRDSAAAEDAVQETIEAALRQRAPFAGQSQLKTWLVGILCHKIADQVRRAQRYVPAEGPAGDALGWEEQLERLGQEQSAGHGWPGAAPWPDPQACLQGRQALARVSAAVAALPERAGQAFLMRELLGCELDEICARLDITANHCHVILHRTRRRLRELLAAEGAAVDAFVG